MKKKQRQRVDRARQQALRQMQLLALENPAIRPPNEFRDQLLGLVRWRVSETTLIGLKVQFPGLVTTGPDGEHLFGVGIDVDPQVPAGDMRLRQASPPE